jgi:hypothetical protein
MPPAPGRPRRHLAAAFAAAQAALAGLAAFAAAGTASAAEVYFQAGLPGVGLGFAQPLNPWAGVRGDVVTLGSRDRNGTEEGITTKAA